MVKDSKHFLLIYSHMRTGGIETLIVRMSNWFIKNGHRVTLLLEESGELIENLDKNIELDILSSNSNNYLFPYFKKKYFRKYEHKGIDCIYSFGPEACYFASLVYKYGFEEKKPVFLNGVYHPQEFALDGGISLLDKMHIYLYNNYVDDRSKFFMSEEVRSGNELILGTKVAESVIWPLPIDDKNYKNIVRKEIPYKIVSIGRLNEFKTYNIYMFDVVEELLQKGYDVMWDIYGSGSLASEMEKQIVDRGLTDKVFMKGVLPYEDFAKALASAHVFIGMGTSIIEAGFCKVLCIPAIESDLKGLTYGPLYKLPYFSCGEVLPDNFQTVPVAVEMQRVFDMTKAEYDAEVGLTLQYVQPYSIDRLMCKFVDYMSSAPTRQIIDSYTGWNYNIYWMKRLISRLRNNISLKKRLRRLGKSLFPIN